MASADALIAALRWPDNGLLPAIAQDARTGQVLTLAWQNRLALERTIASGTVHYWSRSRNALWQKGESSGHVQRLVEVRSDCDLDAVLMLVEPAGPACHTGRPSCFFQVAEPAGWREQGDNPWPPPPILDRLAAVIAERERGDAAKSYVKSLLDQPDKAAAKVREEADELCRAAAAEPPGRVVAEAADLLFHALVLCRTRAVDWQAIATELQRRFGTGGHEEKASRTHDRVGKDSAG